MAISTEDQTKLLKVVTGLFNAAPGTGFLPDLESFIENGGTQQALARELAVTPIFTDTLSGATTSAEQAAILAGNFGLTADNVAGSAATQAIDFFTAGIDANVNIGDLVYEAVMFLSDSPPAEFAEIAQLLDNKAAVAADYSDEKGSSDLSVLQTVFAGITGAAALTAAEIDDLVAAAPGDIGGPGTGTFTLTAAATSVTEGEGLTYTVTASEAVAADTVVEFTVVPSGAGADQGTSDTNDNDFIEGSLNPVSVTILAGQTTATFSVTAANDGITEQVESYTVNAVVGGETLTTTTSLLDGQSISTFTMTTGVDIINGTSGNDLIIADNTAAAKQLSVADSIDGNGGTDTLKVFLQTTDTATGQPTLTDIDNVWLNGGVVTAYTAATGTTGLTVEAPVLNTAATYTIAGQAVTLKDTAVTANTTTTIASAADTTQSVTLSDWTNTAANVNTLDIAGASVTTLNVSGTGIGTAASVNNITLTNTGAALTTLNIAGDKTTTVTEGLAGVTTVGVTNTAGATLNATAALAATFAFTGGAGDDTLSVINNGLAGLTAGTQLDGGAGSADKIATADTALSAAELVIINAATGFEVLGLNGAGVVVDASTLTTIKDFSVDTTALTQTINSMATGSTVTINDVAAPTSLTLGTAVGVIDTSVVLGTAAATGITVGALVTTGITSVSIESNGTAANAITALTNSDNSTFTVTGAQDLTLALSAGTAVGSQIDASTFTGKGTFTGSNIVGSGDIITGGSGIDTINGLAGADTMTGNGGADIFTFTSAAAANASGAVFGQADVITDFVVGTDKLQFSTADVVSAEQTAVQNAVTALTAGSTASQIATAMATASTTNLGVSFAAFEGNSYALYETTGAGVGVAADDVFIQLTGAATVPVFATDVIA